MREPIAEAHRQAVRLGDEVARRRASLLLAEMHLREGRARVGGQAAHQALAWARPGWQSAFSRA